MLGITRETKRLIIVVIVALSLFVFGTVMYFWIRPTPTCTDGIENQNETGIDCGGSCPLACVIPVTGEPLTISEVAFVSSGINQYDVLARITNPNPFIGSNKFSYTLTLRDAAGTDLVHDSGIAWILPYETKTLLVLGMTTSASPAKATIEITNVEWQELTDYREAPALRIYEKRFVPISSGVNFAEVTGVLVNESPFDFRRVFIKAILRDTGGKPIAVHQTQMSTLAVNAREEFHLIWPKAFSGTVSQIEVEADSNVFNQENFLKRYQPNGRFQDFRSTLPQF